MKNLLFIGLLFIASSIFLSCNSGGGDGGSSGAPSDLPPKAVKNLRLRPVTDQTVRELSPIVIIDVNSFQDNDLSSSGGKINYSCYHDKTIDNSVSLTNLCSTVEGLSFQESTGILNWTPSIFQSGNYEFRIVGSVGSEDISVIFNIEVRDALVLEGVQDISFGNSSGSTHWGEFSNDILLSTNYASILGTDYQIIEDDLYISFDTFRSTSVNDLKDYRIGIVKVNLLTGNPDMTFGSSGSFFADTSQTYCFARGLYVDNSENIYFGYLSGEQKGPGESSAILHTAGVMKYDRTGSLVTSFANAGYKQYDQNASTTSRNAPLAKLINFSDGFIFGRTNNFSDQICSYTFDSYSSTGVNLGEVISTNICNTGKFKSIHRFNNKAAWITNGNFLNIYKKDGSFAGAPFVSLGISAEDVRNIEEDSKGNIYLFHRNQIIKYKTNGGLDPDFGSNGKITTNGTLISGTIIKDKIFYSNNLNEIYSYQIEGNQDQEFGTNGKILVTDLINGGNGGTAKVFKLIPHKDNLYVFANGVNMGGSPALYKIK